MTGNIYLDLTNEFNAGRLRAILSGNQAVVMHKILAPAIYGDWIVREDDESLGHILGVLEERGAKYRLGAPLDVRWMRGGWSSHFEFPYQNTRIRTDFVSRPPRIRPDDLLAIWSENERGAEHLPVATIDLRRLAHLKATQRERDYAVISEIARKLETVEERLLWSRSALDLMVLATQFPELTRETAAQSPLLRQINAGRDSLEVALDAERRALMGVDRERLQIYSQAARNWTANWMNLDKQIAELPLRVAHAIVAEVAHSLLPQEPYHESDV